MNVREIIDFLQGNPRNISDDFYEKEFKSIRPLDEATDKDVSFLYDKKYLEVAKKSKAALLIAPPHLASSLSHPLVEVEKPRMAVLKLLEKWYPPSPPVPHIASTAVIANSVSLARNVSVGHYSVIEEKGSVGEETVIESHVHIGRNVHIGKKCHIHSGVVLYDNCDIGNEVVLHAGVVVGSDGFGYLQKEGRNLKVPQLGRVIIEDDVEIGANTSVDCGMLGDTVIGENTKIDNLVQIAHNVKIGKSCIIAGNSALAGSVTLENNVIIAGQVGVRDNITIREGAVVPARTGVGKDVPSKSIVSSDFKRLRKMEGRLERQRKKLERIEKNLEDTS